MYQVFRDGLRTLNASPPHVMIANLCCSVVLVLTDSLDLLNHVSKREASLGQGRKFIPCA